MKGVNGHYDTAINDSVYDVISDVTAELLRQG